MKYLRFLLLLALVIPAYADHGSGPDKRPAVLVAGLGSVQHPVSTKNKEAQQFFDQGMAFLFAFNHDEATRSFRRAAELDPKLAMAQWGIGLSLGANYNDEGDCEREGIAFEASQKALKLTGDASEPEKAYIQALALRYSDNAKADKKKLAVAYAQAMGQVAKQYPDDLDAATLYAESMMNLRPWDLWTHDGKPNDGTLDILAVLESVLRRNPEHTGANHFYIHAVEASNSPERALPSAERLKTLARAAGHLVHMPSHVYIRVGDYAEAAKANERAIAIDEAYLKTSGNTKGIYGLMYYSHNIHFLSIAQALQGRNVDALTAAKKLTAHVGPAVADMPMLEGFMPVPILVEVMFCRWDDVLALPAPDKKEQITTALWHFARGRAYLGQGKLDEAAKERQNFAAVQKTIPADTKFGLLNKAHGVLAVAQHMLDGKLALARKDTKGGIAHLERAVEAEDALNYAEPPDWYLSVREALGAAHLGAGNPVQAEKVFRAELNKHRRSGRALFGLRAALKAQKRDYEAALVDLEFQRAWKNADAKLRLEDF